MRIARRCLIPFAFAALALGCGRSPTKPREILPHLTRALALDLSISGSDGSPSDPLTIEASIRNTGTAPVRGLQGGGVCDGIGIDVLDAQGGRVLTFNPCFVPLPLCTLPGPFEPGDSQRTTLIFNGDAYRAVPGGCERFDAPAGSYTAVVAFSVQWTANEAPEPIERRVAFHWTAP